MREPTTDASTTPAGPGGTSCRMSQTHESWQLDFFFTGVSPRGTRLFWD